MARIYTNQKTKISVISGKVTAVGDDKRSISVATQQFNKETKKYEDVSMDFETQTPLDDSVKVGDFVTIAGFERVDMMSETSKWIAGYVSTGNDSFQYKTLAVVNGEVMFARFMEEVGEDGKPNMTRERMGADGKMIAPKPKSPHFDIGVATVEQDGEGGTKRVLHIVKAYPDKDAQGKKNFDKIEALKKRFANFDKETNPMRVTIATQPGTVSSSTKEWNGNTYENNYNNHMGVYSLDIEYLKGKEKEQTEEKAEEAPAPAEEAPAEKAPAAQPAPAATAAPVQTAPEDTMDDVDSLFSIS